MTTEHTVVSFREIKKKAVQFSGRLLAIIATFAFSYPVCTENVIRVDAVMESPKPAE
jgi:hypothetical protein